MFDAMTDFEMSLLGGAVDLSAAQTLAPIKSPEEIRVEWLNSRRGFLSASNNHLLMSFEEWLYYVPYEIEPVYRRDGKTLAKNQPKPPVDKRMVLPPGAITYCEKVAAQRLSTADESETRLTTQAMQWGIDCELEGIQELSKAINQEILHTGINQKFIKLGEYIGATPDGITINGIPVELKCPNTETHFKYQSITDWQSLKAIEPKYYWQVQGQMQVTGSSFGIFASYDKRADSDSLKLHIAIIERNDFDIARLEKRQAMGIKYIQNYIAEKIKYISNKEAYLNRLILKLSV